MTSDSASTAASAPTNGVATAREASSVIPQMSWRTSANFL